MRIPSFHVCDDVAEWLRREIANLVLFEREGSNPFVVDNTFVFTFMNHEP
jgi:hypothetical protein